MQSEQHLFGTQIAALAVALKYAASPEFKVYAKQVHSGKAAFQAVPVSSHSCSCGLLRRDPVMWMSLASWCLLHAAFSLLHGIFLVCNAPQPLGNLMGS